MADEPAPQCAEFRHRVPGRARVRLKSPVADAKRLEDLADLLSVLAGVHKVDINPATGSILFRHEHACDPLIAAEEAGLLRILLPPEAEPFDPAEAILERIGQADAAISRASGGRMDAMQAAMVGLVLGGLVQLARGQIAGPALTLFGQAATLAMARPLRKFVR